MSYDTAAEAEPTPATETSDAGGRTRASSQFLFED